MPSLTIRLPDHAAAALHDLAQVECRTPRDQAAFLILEGLRAARPMSALATVYQPRRRRSAIQKKAVDARLTGA
jgi:hypothetical protein